MFNYDNKIVQYDIESMAKVKLPWSSLNGKSILITGATGMLATYIVYLLLYLNEKGIANIKIFALCHTKIKAETLFAKFIEKPYLQILLQDVCDPIQINNKIDYIFHFAGNASPYFIINDPVGITKSNILGTYNILELAKASRSEKVIFSSTREVYGKNDNETLLKENSFGTIDPMDDRSCYPESKRTAETLLRCYYLQYGIKSNPIRIAHSYGPGMKLHNDGRVMADLMSNVVDGKNIVLKSTGDTERAFCYITDAVIGLFYVLFKGEDNKAYNLANETQPISIKELAEKLVQLYPNKDLKVVIDIPTNQQKGYCNYKRVKLSTSRIEELGWKPTVTLEKGLVNTLNSFLL